MIRPVILFALLCARIVSSHTDADTEFPVPPVTDPIVSPVPLEPVLTTTAAEPARETRTRPMAPHDWTFEIVSALAVVSWAVFFALGRRTNAQLSQAVLDVCGPELNKQFSQASPLSRVSDAAWELWCSGRRSCLGLFLTVALKPRQDLLATVLGSFAPQLAIGQQVDVITIEVPLPADTPAFVFSVFPARKRKDVVEARKDLSSFKLKPVPAITAGLPASFEALSEATEITEVVLRPLRTLINEHPRVLRSLHISDAPETLGCSAAAVEFQGCRCLWMELQLPETRSGWDASLLPFLRAVFSLIDTIAVLSLSKEASQRVSDNRSALRKTLVKAQQSERDDALRRAREEKKRQEDAQLNALNREELRKIEERKRKEAMAKALPRMKFKVG